MELNEKSKPIYHIEENTEENLGDPGLGKYCQT